MGPAEHRIGRLVFEIAVPDRAALGRFGAAVRANFDAVILPALQRGLDSIDRPDGVIRLGRVEVDIGTLDSAALAADDLARRIADGLAAALPAASPLEPTGTAPARDDSAELAAFLETGELPWSEPGRALATLAAALMSLDAPGMSHLATRLRTVLIHRRAAERLVRQLPAALVRRLFRALLPEALDAPLAAAYGRDGAGEAASVEPFLDRLVPALTEAIHQLARDTGTPDAGDLLALFIALDGRASHVPAWLPAGTAPSPETEASKPEPEPEPPASDERPEPTRPEPDEPGDKAQSSPRPIYAAGAVLLHPFFGALFERIGLLGAPGRFSDRSARVRSVLLAHHLATGAEEAPEPETMLFKLLCGMEFSEPVPRRVDLTDAERSEADALLTSVIDHWGRLGNSSPAGLREGFLTRPGRLERQGALWRLTVEPRGIDVLLDGLPWTLSRVKTPFMREPLAVDWC